MVAFEVFLNGERLALAGAEDLGVLIATVAAVGALGPNSKGARGSKGGHELRLHVGGLTARGGENDNEHLGWRDQDELKAGDEVLIRVVETPEADAPQRRRVDTGCGSGA